MFDFHSHILPGLDDGSRNVTESIAMLHECMHQGISGIAATPHFYASMMTPSSFLKARMESFRHLQPNLSPDMPNIRLGAEVHYYEGIHRSNEILELRIQGTNLLLLEMPFRAWSQRMLKSVIALNERPGITVLLAHIERYLADQSDNTWRYLQSNGILMQSNATFFINRKTAKKALKLFKSGSIHLLGSDCHNMNERKPNLAEAVDIIRAELGTRAVDMLAQHEETLLNEI